MNSAIPNCFKDCDIRGIYPEEVYPALFESVGRALGQQIMTTAFSGLSPGTVVVGGDARLSTPALKAAFLAGLSEYPLTIIDLGVVPTNVVYWAKAQKQVQCSAQITASHNPPQFNGLKVMNGEFPPTPEFFSQLAENLALPKQEVRAVIQSWPSVVADYTQWLISKFANQGIETLHVGVDPGNGCLSEIASGVFQALNARVTALFDVRDGSFPGRAPDSAIPKNLTALMQAVTEKQANLGFAFDGDGDRLGVIDNLGRYVGAEHLGMYILSHRPEHVAGKAVIMDNKCSFHLDHLVAKLGGNPVRCKSGHAYMKKSVITHAANLGIEVSGHYFSGALDGRDDPLYSALEICSYLAGDGQPMSAVLNGFPPMIMTEDIRVALSEDSISHIIETLSQGLWGAEVDLLDGARLIWENGWLLARRSITEPKITLRFEGATLQDLREIAERFGMQFPELKTEVAASVDRIISRGATHE